ncbi:hypothetical protein [Roseateles violae]|uniref:Tyr recombinase domain-containing protein n=1 Tax=Roseateles violae TaxID=3058042 RepID=A0ABT8DJY3_9BURK|nr:hypothetical protein [Pelomonas sp. PFR6]MDN3918730.1 hypothetical protein [Pelomonas sp. PFR6]
MQTVSRAAGNNSAVIGNLHRLYMFTTPPSHAEFGACSAIAHPGSAPESDTPQPASTAMTYRQLLDHGVALFDANGKQQAKNMASALRLWVQVHGYSFDKPVGEEFSVDFDKFFLRFGDVIAERLAKRTQRDRQEQVLRWRRIAEELRRRDLLPATFSDALQHCIKTSPLTLRQIARDSGIGAHSLRYWADGRGQPRGAAVTELAKLEATLELPLGTLSRRLPPARRTRYERGVAKNDKTTSFTKIRKAQLARLKKPYAMEFSSALSAQWTDLLRLKTDPMRDEARARNTWRVKPLERVGSLIKPWMVVDGQVCPTAGVHWQFFASYLGWLTLPRPEGPGIPHPEAQTLAWLADHQQVIAYAKWRIGLSGRKFHNGVNVLLQLVESYLRAQTGFLWLRPELRASVPSMALLIEQTNAASCSETAAWQRHCELARRELREFREKTADTMGIRLSRDPTERLATVLHDEFPLKKLLEFIETLERSAPPPAHQRDYCAWIRDVTLCRLLVSNPLRASQYAAMTFRADGSGNLYRAGPGRYCLRFEPQDFKNEKGAAKEKYEVEVDTSVVPWIDRYLAESRPHMVDAEVTDRFFLATVVGPRKHKAFLEEQGLEQPKGWSAHGILARMKTLTSTYIEGCAGFGGHGFRHIIATDHLRRNPGDCLTVATLLHDKLETVLKNYAHLKPADGLRALSMGIREATAQLAAQRKR